MKTNRLALGLLIVACLTSSAHSAVTYVGGMRVPFTRVIGPVKNVPVDFDADGTAELNFIGEEFSYAAVRSARSTVELQAVPETLPNPGALAVRMGYEVVVSSTPSSFAQWNYNASSTGFLGCNSIGCYGLWQDFDDPYWASIVDYLGVRFWKEDGWHYGWVEVEVLSNAGAFVKGYAWETTPNTPILTPAVVPEPQRAGLVLAGSLALLLRRRRPVSISRREAAGLLSLAVRPVLSCRTRLPTPPSDTGCACSRRY